ncbi:Hypothetical_protein [Hexamita inflata]|uniref:Hypothetical_protein n=1 Tax=Hexamita inflata TaxID=28002 RepID=A0AA86NRI1_9EUKA|nr:Hypothetical protein HINF_LOCUS11766 [Hexamita inflata]
MEYCWLKQINRHWQLSIINKWQPQYINLVSIDRLYSTIQWWISSYVCEVAKYFNKISVKWQFRKDTFMADHCTASFEISKQVCYSVSTTFHVQNKNLKKSRPYFKQDFSSGYKQISAKTQCYVLQ